MTDKALRIVELRAEAVKRIKAVRIKPDGSLVVITGKNGAGKQQPVSEPVLTPTGWRPIGELRPGDFVIGSDGKGTKVRAVHPQTERATYLVRCADGSQTRCGPEHLWTVSFWRSGQGLDRKQSHLVTETMTTSQMIDRGIKYNAGKRSNRFSLPVLSPVQFADLGAELPIDPYTLGVILGDGHIEPKGYVTITSHDDEIFSAVAPPEFWRGKDEIGSAFWSRPLRHLGLAGKLAFEKFIPAIYLMASIEDRKALLAGLLDTDGTATTPWASYCTTSEKLADDVTTLGRSLGYICERHGSGTKKYRYNGELRIGRPAWIVTIRSEECPFHLSRKSARWRRSESLVYVRGIIDAVERVEDEDSVCIEVDAEDGLYVANDFILTHNSSILDSIVWALAGERAIDAVPIRAGQERAKIVLDLGDLIVERVFRKADSDAQGGSVLVVKNREGMTARAPQALLDRLVGDLSFDPAAFVRMKPADQVSMLRRAVASDVDFEQLDARRADLFQRRRDLSRDYKSAVARADAFVVPADVPAEPHDLEALMDDVNAASASNALRIGDLQAKARLEQEIAGTKAAYNSMVAQLSALKTQHDDLVAALAAATVRAAVDVEPLTARYTAARVANDSIRVRDQHEAALAEAASLAARVEALTGQLVGIDKAKVDAIAAAKLPVPGLSWGAAGVTLDDLPFEQASTAQQIRVAVAIAMAANPRLRILRIKEGSSLDQENLALLGELATEHDFQVWIERVGEGEPGQIVIEDGEVVA